MSLLIKKCQVNYHNKFIGYITLLCKQAWRVLWDRKRLKNKHGFVYVIFLKLEVRYILQFVLYYDILKWLIYSSGTVVLLNNMSMIVLADMHPDISVHNLFKIDNCVIVGYYSASLCQMYCKYNCIQFW